MDKSLNDIIHSTIFNMLDSAIFYVPKGLVELCAPEDMEKLHPYINKLILVSDKGIRLIDEGDNPSLTVMKKFNLLNEGNFMLYKLKERLGDESFGYVVEKYGEIVEVFHFGTEWLNDNVERDIEGLTKEQRLAFKTQHELHQKHKQEFEKRFQLPKKEISTDNAVSEKLLSLFKGMSTYPTQDVTKDNSEPTEETQEAQEAQKMTGIGKRAQKRERLQTLKKDALEKAEKHLLEAVFNVKMGK